MQEPQHLQVAQNRGRRGPCTAVSGSEQDLAWSLPTLQRQRGELSPAGCRQHQQDLAQRGGSMGTQPQGTSSLLVLVAGRDTSSNASSNTPISCLEGSAGQLSRSGVNSSLPAMTGGRRKKPSGITVPMPCLFWMAVAKDQSLCCLCSFHFPIMLRSPSTGTNHAKMGGCFPSV